MKSAHVTICLLALLFGVACANAAERPKGPLTLDRALADALRLAERHEGGEVVRVEGDSMFPYFGDGSVLVTKSVAPERLRPGMVVVYRNRFGDTVAHRLERLAEDGWVTRGYNNDQEDSTRVTGENLLGVVYATFYSNGRIADESVLASLLESTRVVLAAPAR